MSSLQAMHTVDCKPRAEPGYFNWDSSQGLIEIGW